MSAFTGETSRNSPSPFIAWGHALLDDPKAALSDILSGRGARGSQQQAEPEDFLADLLAHPVWQDQRAQLTEGLDEALLNWLETCIEWPPARINRFGTRAYAARIADALKVAARLPLKVTAQHLVWNQHSWDNRFLGMRLPGDIDLLRRFDLVLAQHQTDGRFAARWFAACDEAAWGSPYWRTRLSSGLIGLRRLPDTADTAPERRVAAALARFGALALQRGINFNKVRTTFQRRAAALAVLYPRHDSYWVDLWDRTIKELASSMGGNSCELLKDWLKYILSEGKTNGEGGRRHAYRSIFTGQDALPERWRREEIAKSLDQASSLSGELWKKTRELIRAHWNYALRSGESHFATRTTHNLCDRLLQLGPAKSYLAEIQVWTFQAIQAEADNEYIWDLWAKVLSTLGQDNASLSVRWESIRRFPDNCVLRNSLSKALLMRNQLQSAEGLLRETIRDFPRDPFCRTMLARLLASTERVKESEYLLRKTIQDFPKNEVCRNVLAELFVRTERGCEANNLLRETIGMFPWDIYSRVILIKMLWEQGRQEEAKTEFAALKALALDNTYVQSLAEMMATTQPGEAWTSLRKLSTDWETDSDTWTGHQINKVEVEGNRIVSEPEINAYLDRLSSQVDLLKNYFSPSGTASTPGNLHIDTVNSEFELVAAHRTELMEEPEQREYLKAWTSARPSSYSARLLLAWQGGEGNGLDRDAMFKIAREFPENHSWNEWLCYGFLPKEQRSKLRQGAKKGNDTDTAFWSGRLSSVYPDLHPQEGEDENESRVDSDGTALKRLLEDIALAGADRALPDISIS